MRITRTTALTLLAPILSAAQSEPNDNPNAFQIPDGGLSFTAGESTTVNWDPTTSGTVTLILRSGASSNLAEGVVVASEIDNSGSFTWTPDTDITRGSDYTLQIVDDADPSLSNYSPYFVVESDNTVASETGQVTLGAPAESRTQLPPSSTASPTGELTNFLSTVSTTEMVESESVVAATVTESVVTSTTSTTATGEETTAATTETETQTGAAATSSGAEFQGQDEESDSPEEGGAPRATAMVGMLGAVAVAALAL